MPVDVIWDCEDRTVLRYVIVAPWTWNEFWTAFNIGHELLTSVDHHVDQILDADYALRTAPPGMLAQIRNLYRRLSPQHGLTALIATRESGVSAIWLRLALMVYPSAKVKFIFVEDLEDARHQLTRRRTLSAPQTP